MGSGHCRRSALCLTFRRYGVVHFKYYGELFDPELRNLAVFTAGFGMRPTKRSTIDLVFHDYRQHRATSRLRNAQLDISLSGLERHLGREIDVVFGYSEIADLRLKVIMGYFKPGNLFSADADNGFYAAFESRIRFLIAPSPQSGLDLDALPHRNGIVSKVWNPRLNIRLPAGPLLTSFSKFLALPAA